MTSRERILAALTGRPVDRPPLWIMRQAGRYLPEYRALKEKHSFRQMVTTPELAVEVTLMPLRRYAFDAAITFSDILVIPEALGIAYQFDNNNGISMERLVSNAGDIEGLSTASVLETLHYIPTTQRLLRRELGNKTALLGFAGTPWTLACYMVEGTGSSHPVRLKRMARESPQLFHRLLNRLTEAVSEYCLAQAAAGVDAIQLFDSAAPSCPSATYQDWSLQWVTRIAEHLNGKVPLIYFVRGMGSQLERMAETGVNALSLDWTVDLPSASDALRGRAALQGNFDPALLDGPPGPVRTEVQHSLAAMNNRPGYIANLGHGIFPSARLESVEALVQVVTEWEAPA